MRLKNDSEPNSLTRVGEWGFFYEELQELRISKNVEELQELGISRNLDKELQELDISRNVDEKLQELGISRKKKIFAYTQFL